MSEMMRTDLLEKLQDLRKQLYLAAEKHGNLTNPEVLAISEEADRLIIVLQQQGRALKAERI